MGAITYTTGETCYPAVYARDAVDPQVIVEPNLGWNSTARSTDTIAASTNGYVEFETCATPTQIVAGFGLATVSGTNTDPWLSTHAFYITSSAVQIYEAGAGTISLTDFGPLAAPAAGRVYRIQRVSGTVSYYIDDILVRTSTRLSTAEIYLDVSLYRAGDYVENPIIDDAVIAATNGYFNIPALPALDVVFWGNNTGTAYPHAGANEVGGQIGRAGAPLDLPALEDTFTLSNRMSISAQIPALDVLWSNKAYAEIETTFPATTAGLAGTQTDYAHTAAFYPQFPPLIAYMHGWASYPISIGEDGGDPLYFPQIDAVFSGRGYTTAQAGANPTPYKYAQIGGASEAAWMQMDFVAYFDDGFPEGWLYYETFEFLAFSDYYNLGEVAVVSLAEGLELTDAFDLYYFHDAELEEGADFTDAYTLAEIVTQLIEEGVQITNALPQQDLDTLQYAVNAATGALTTYRNFGFTSFCRLGDTTYAVRPGGLYKLRHGSDAGEIAGGIIDFGDHDFGTAERKNVDSLYLGLSNDGEVYARLTDDNGGENYYQVVQTAPTARVIAGRGVTARRYGLRLDIVDTANFELDNIEFSVGVAVRRRMP